MNAQTKMPKDILRKFISARDDELVIFGADNFSQFPSRNNSIRSSCDRALPGASSSDLVVLRGSQNLDYYNWLRSLGLGPKNFVEYKQTSSEFSLAQCIIKNPEPILNHIKNTGKRPIYVPWFSGQMEEEAAKIIGADLFGATEKATTQYNDKAQFKNICKKLAIPVVTGKAFNIAPNNKDNSREMSRIIINILSKYEEIIIRGTLGKSGMSLFKTKGSDIQNLYDEIVASGEETVIIEPFMDVISTPNDQWVIGNNGTVGHLGIADQLCESGMIHVGTQSCQKQSNRVVDYIMETSRTIVDHMTSFGYKGVLGIDYIVTNSGIFPVENNARFNGSTYVRLVLEQLEKKRFSAPCWKFIKIQINPCSFSELIEKLGPLLYDDCKLNSVFPYNCNAIQSNGFLSLIMFGEDYNHLMHLEKELGRIGIKRA